MTKKLKVGLIGCGYWGNNYIRVLNDLSPLCELLWCCDQNKDILNKIKLDIKKTSDYLEVLKDSEVDAVVIAVPTTLHYDVTKSALEHGKHVLVEKPITTSSSQAFELSKLADKNKRVLMVGHIFEYNSSVGKMKSLIGSGELGNIFYFYSTRTGLGPVRKDVNVIWDLATHDVSILLNLFKDIPESVIAFGESYIQKGIEDVVFINLKFKDKKIANIHVSWLDPHKIRKTTIIGSKKMVIFDDVSMEDKIIIFDKGIDYFKEKGASPNEDYRISLRTGDKIIPKIEVIEPLKEQTRHFLDCIIENKKPLTDGLNGYNVVKILEAAQKSLKNDSKEVKIGS